MSLEKNNLHIQEEHQETLQTSSEHKEAQTSEATEEETPCPSSEDLQEGLENSSVLGSSDIPEELCTIPSPTRSVADFLSNRASKRRKSQQYDEQPSTSTDTDYTETYDTDFSDDRVDLMEHFILYKFERQLPICKEELMSFVGVIDEDEFAEILKTTSQNMEFLFGVTIQEANRDNIQYELVSKLKLPNNGRIYAGNGLPKTGFVMTILGVIFMMGNHATEEELWKFLRTMHVRPGRKHYVFGEPHKLVTEDLVRLQYLEYRQVPNSDPPCYEFLWGPRAYEEINKMEVLEFLAKVSNDDPRKFSTHYEEALKDIEERAKANKKSQTQE
ncbi:melanoma-associated antigen B5-like [Perognathus longimembris pacificus]|uniref:melanoma-associated antigen B5-like n=1 Tax=Perognathus longimembris pacificus TaxID=214514 RepID=UPI002019BC74|nr:melanoma-associated antigen B5-like [Perognathus longimembris pacificus]